MKKLSILLCIFVLVLGVMTSCGTPVTAPTVAPRTEPPIPETVLGEFTAEKFAYRLLSASVSLTTLFEPVATADPQVKYLLVYVEVKNLSEDIAGINSNKNFALYVNGEKAKQVFDVDVYAQPDYPSINPGDTKRGEIAYRIPFTATSVELAVLDNEGAELTRFTVAVPELNAPTATPTPAPTPEPTPEG